MRTPALGLAAGALLVGQLTAQSERCTLQIDNVDRQGIVQETPQGTNYYAGGNVRLSCRGTKIRMRSDSVAAYGGSVVEFIGNVHYEDSTLIMDADRGTYTRAEERWEARGRVKTRNLKTGSTLTGPSLDYFRVARGVRDTAEMYAVGRPRIEYATKDSTGQLGEPYIIVADRVRTRGDDRLWGGGRVTIDRSDFAARGDSLRLDTGPANDGTLLGGRPELHGLGADTFDLVGERLDFRLEDRELTYLVAIGDAKAIQKDWTLVADTIALDLEDRKLTQTLAWGDSLRPRATSERYDIRADSLALDSPGRTLREARAFGSAWLGGEVDSASAQRDWLSGDTVRATFGTRDSAGTTTSVLERLEARQNARSLQVVRTNASGDSEAAKGTKRATDAKRATDPPTFNYARGDRIVITMRTDGSERVDRVDAYGNVFGVQLEPSPGAPAPAAGAGRPTPKTPKPAAPDSVPADSVPATLVPADTTQADTTQGEP